jgi:hypothetical protein
MKTLLGRALTGEEFSAEYLDERTGRRLVGHVAQLRDEQGQREGIVVICVDTAEQKQPGMP